jgi:hypothetical protein
MKTKITAAGRRVTIYRAPDGLWRWESEEREPSLRVGLANLAAAVADAQTVFGRDVAIMHSPEPS